jgi:hypothetical protein
LDRDRVLYLAGQASVRTAGRSPSHSSWLWPCATAASLLLAVTLGGILLLRDGAAGGGQLAQRPPVQGGSSAASSGGPTVPASDVAVLSSPSPRTDYLALRWLVLNQGVDALPERSEAAAPYGNIPTPGDLYGQRIRQQDQG